MNKKYKEQHRDFLRNNISIERNELVRAFNEEFGLNTSKDKLNTLIASLCLKGGVNRFEYQAEHDDFISENFHLPVKEIWEKFNEHFGVSVLLTSMRGRVNHLLKIRDGGGLRRLKINGRNIPLAQFVWECINGKLSDEYSVIFADGNRSNYCIENLKAVPKSVVRTARAKVGHSMSRCVCREARAAVFAVSALENKVLDNHFNNQEKGKNHD